MTCIVGLVQEGKAYVGGDAAGSSSSGQVTMRTDPKVILRDDYLFGFTSSFRMGDILEFRVPVPKERPAGVSLRKHLVTNWVDDHLRRVFEKLGYLYKDKNVESGGTFVVAHKGELCVIYDDFQVGTPIEGYASVGSGCSYALGALHALRNIKDVSGLQRVTYALEAASYHNAYVRPPFTILES